MENQAVLNIGTVGHVSHGKSTLVKMITGVDTSRYYDEQARGITIKIGYANAKIYCCTDTKCDTYVSFGTKKNVRGSMICCKKCGALLQFKRHVSFVDCPGHDYLMSTMLSGAAVMDAAIVVIAGNETCPQSQTSEHIIALELLKLKNVLVLQNKMDLVTKKQAIQNYDEIKTFIKGTLMEHAPILPICAQQSINIDIVLKYICNIPIPTRDFKSGSKLSVIRSFDVNKPGCIIKNLRGGVIGGSVSCGIFKINDTIEIRPGLVSRSQSGRLTYKPIMSKITTLYSEKTSLNTISPGGLVAMGTTMDPTLTKQDRLVGQTVGLVGHLPNVYIKLEINYFLLRRLLGTRKKVSKLKNGENISLSISTCTMGGKILAIRNDAVKILLKSFICATIGDKISCSRRIDGKWRLIGWGNIRHGK